MQFTGETFQHKVILHPPKRNEVTVEDIQAIKAVRISGRFSLEQKLRKFANTTF